MAWQCDRRAKSGGFPGVGRVAWFGAGGASLNGYAIAPIQHFAGVMGKLARYDFRLGANANDGVSHLGLFSIAGFAGFQLGDDPSLESPSGDAVSRQGLWGSPRD